MELYWIWLHTVSGASVKGQLRALEAFGTPEAVFRAETSALLSAGISQKDCEALRQHDLAEAHRILKECREKQIRLLTYHDRAYPSILRAISDAPTMLYYSGVLPEFENDLLIAVVGQRRATAGGILSARRLGYELARAGAIVVSGAARGIDTGAMDGALIAEGPVVAVLGCGLDVVYPRENRRLLEKVKETGCLLSEYAPGVPPIGWHFPVRNRIISGLCRGVVVVEAERKSGSLNTAQHALEQGRDVFAVPGEAGRGYCAGSNDLLRQGAGYAERGSDVIGNYAYLFRDRVRLLRDDESISFNPAFFDAAEPQEKPAPPEPETKAVEPEKRQTRIDVAEAAAGLPANEAAVLRTLEGGPLRTDEIIDRSELPAADALCALTMLEIRALVQSHPGGSYSLALKPK